MSAISSPGTKPKRGGEVELQKRVFQKKEKGFLISGNLLRKREAGASASKKSKKPRKEVSKRLFFHLVEKKNVALGASNHKERLAHSENDLSTL